MSATVATAAPNPPSPARMLVPARALTLLAAALGGLLTDTAFPQRSWWPLAIVGMAVLVVALRRDSARWNALVAWVWGLAFFLPHIWWANAAVGVIPWLALSVAEAGVIAAGAAVWTWSRRAAWLRGRLLLPGVVFAVVWVVAEQLRQVWPFGGFPWGRLAFSQVDGPLLPFAAIAGAPAVSFVTALCGFWLAAAVIGLLMRRRASPDASCPASRGVIIGAGAGVAAILAVGLVIPTPTAAQTGTLRLGAVQGNVSEPGLGAFANAREVLTNHVNGTLELSEEVGTGTLDLVLWPENATDINPREDADAAAMLDDAASAIGTPILFGTDSYGLDADGNDARFNDMVLWEVGEGAVFSYAKQIPAAFAEYIPIRDFARIFSSAVDLVRTDIAPGTEIAVVPVDLPRLERTVQVATVICFEVAYDAVIREAVQGGAEVLFVPTNNASFGYTAESEQQLAMSQLRAVEHGRATVQISTVGVSGVIAADGTVLERTELFTHDTLTAELPLRSSLTVADRLGDWPIILATVLVACAFTLGLVTGRRRSGQ
ncbi:apolipoprotein N-acyltransferase [Ruania halotolerans]|uniref:apolipoprotein N-acyltransferase n=1 Tax=Ruania halotolerans TaxID=2897773 RepID=UPI001E3455E5|nr:apolipoprotein N-acyltransferase [Ruania halotolerans]UFU08273.1 apolipoprotein N-acyltransferase [Ruania halotolerans]